MKDKILAREKNHSHVSLNPNLHTKIEEILHQNTASSNLFVETKLRIGHEFLYASRYIQKPREDVFRHKIQFLNLKHDPHWKMCLELRH